MVSLKVDGMSCPTACPPKIQSALKDVKGVNSVAVDFEHGQATVVCSKDTDTASLVAALDKAGFHGSAVN